MGYCENNSILYTTMPTTITLNIYDSQGKLEEQRMLTFTTYPGDNQAGIYYFNRNGRPVPTRDLIDSVDV